MNDDKARMLLQYQGDKGTVITFEFDAEEKSSLDSMLEQYCLFLRGIGYGISDEQFDAITLGWQE